MTIQAAFNAITEELGGTPSTDGTIAGAIDALNDTLAGSNQERGNSIEDAVKLLGEHIGSGSAQETYEASIMFVTDGESGDIQEAIEGIVLFREDSSSEPIVVERVDDTEIPIQLPAGGVYEIEIDGEDYDSSLPPTIYAGFEFDGDFFSVQCGRAETFFSFVMPAHDIEITIQGTPK